MNQFELLGLNKPIVKSIAEMGFEAPTPIQEKVIPHLLEGNTDLVALSQTGTGKTAAFGFPLLSLLDFNSKDTQALILCPTRELCIQITRDLQTYATYLPDVNVVAIYGGAAISTQITNVRKGAQIIVATPGRMVDMIQRKKVKLNTIRYVILDEADEMLNMGFKEDLDTILSETPSEKNTWLFSATMPDEVSRISKNYMHDPIEITMGSKNQGNENIEHIYFQVRTFDKYAAVKRLVDYHQDIFGIVFCRTKRETQQVADQLVKDGYSADAIHGDLSQAQRDQVMRRYRNRTIRLLVATDVAARGIDVNDITHIINYNLPDELENYTHRSGRTARAGKKGISVVLAGSGDSGKIRSIERMIKRKFIRGTLPSVEEVKEKQLLHIVKSIQEVDVDEERISAVLPQINAELENLSREELINRFLSVEFNRLPEVSESRIDVAGSGAREGRNGEGRNGYDKDTVKLYINLGKYDDLDKFGLLSFINQETGIEEREITVLDVKNSYSFIRIRQDLATDLISRLKNKSLGNREVTVEIRHDSADRSYRSRDRSKDNRNRERKFSTNRKNGQASAEQRRRKRTYHSSKNLS